MGCQRKTDEGYYQSKLTNDNSICRTELIHRLVASAFIPNPDNKPTVNHKDGNKKNNFVDNLEWATDSEQMDHAYNNSLRFDNKYIAKINIFTNKIIETYISIHEASRNNNNINISNIHSVCNGKRNHAGGFKWKYINNI